jgi:hypothetical protein
LGFGRTIDRSFLRDGPEQKGGGMADQDAIAPRRKVKAEKATEEAEKAIAKLALD